MLKKNGPGGCCCGCVPQNIPIAGGWAADSGWTISGGTATCASGQTNQRLSLAAGPNGPFGNAGCVRFTIPVTNGQTVRTVWQYVDSNNYRYAEWKSTTATIAAYPYTARTIVAKIGEVIGGVDTAVNTYSGVVDWPFRSITKATITWSPTAASLKTEDLGFQISWPSFTANEAAGSIGIIAVDTATASLALTAAYDLCPQTPAGCGYCVDTWGPYQYQVVLTGATPMWALPNFSGTWVCTATYFVDYSLYPGCVWRTTSGTKIVDVRIYPGGVGHYLQVVDCYLYGTIPLANYYENFEYGFNYPTVDPAPYDCLGYEGRNMPVLSGPTGATCTLTALP